MVETLLFVYGTLRRGEGNHRFLADAAYVGDACLRGCYRMVSLGSFPGVTPAQDVGVIVGELYWVDPWTLAAIDRLEGHPRFYQRQQVVLATGEVAWTYIYPAADAAGRQDIPGGDWRGRETACVSR